MIKKYSKVLIPILIIIFICIAYFSIIDKNYALKINNEKISQAEYKAYLFEQKKQFEEKGGSDIWETDFDGVPAEEVAKQNAINSLLLVKTSVSQAPKLGIELNDDEKKSIKQKSLDYIKKINQESNVLSLTEKDAETIISDSLIQQKVYDFVTKGFVMSDVDFEAFFDEYYETNKKELNSVKIRYIFKKSSAEESEVILTQMQKLYERILVGEDFIKIQKENSDDTITNIIDIKDANLGAEVEDVAYSLNQGEVSDVIYTDNGFYIIKAEKVTTPNMNQLRSQVMETYVNQKKQEIYQNQVGKWAENILIEKNSDVWNTIHISDV